MSAQKARNNGWLVAIGAAVGFFLHAGSAAACRELLLEAAFDGAEVVFIGTPDMPGSYASPLKFNVTRVLKGKDAKGAFVLRDVAAGCRGWSMFESNMRSDPSAEFVVFAKPADGDQYDVFQMQSLPRGGTGDAWELLQKVAPPSLPSR